MAPEARGDGAGDRARGARVCFVTCLRWPEVDESDARAAEALARRGVEVEARPWNAPGARFDGFAAAVFRSDWDYHHDPGGFLAWLDRWEGEGVRFWNPPALVRWNLTKRYLLDLEAAGVPIVPTAVLEEPASLEAVIASRGWDTVVVKPVLAASAHDATLVRPEERGATARALGEGRIRRPVLVQPFIEEVRTDGEWSLVFIEGRLTHAVLKRPAPDDFRVQSYLGGRTVAGPPPPVAIAAGQRAMAALPMAPLYARIDGIVTAEGFLVMEVELHEPGLFFTLAPAAAEAFADAVIARLSRASDPA